MSNVNQVICNINDRLNALQAQVYQLTLFYQTTVGGFQVVIPCDVHKLPKIKGYLLTDPQGYSIEISFRVLSNLTVQVDSNVDMTGCTLLIY